MARRQDHLGLDTLSLMDIDGPRLELIGQLLPQDAPFKITQTTDAVQALTGADYVITTFRVGGIAARVVDEIVPLRHGVLGQETTGPGGFAMALRSIPVLLGYLELMRMACPDAWLVNFANPAGLMAEAAIGLGHWDRTIGICDAPEGMTRVAAAVLGADPREIYLDYFGLNHLGWVRGVHHGGTDHLPRLIEMLRALGGLPGLPFSMDFVASLGMIPNEYLFYYYHSRQAVANLLEAGVTRGQQLVALNEAFFDRLAWLADEGDVTGMAAAHRQYLHERGDSYMARETGEKHDLGALGPALAAAIEGEGYAGIALDVIEALSGKGARHLVVNVPNNGAIPEMAVDAVVEIPAYIGPDLIRPLAVCPVPAEQLALMQAVKAYERLSIRAVAEGSRAAALHALAVHPLVADVHLAEQILDGYVAGHGALFPELK
jgi:6-phospho-beta-glucosidase